MLTSVEEVEGGFMEEGVWAMEVLEEVDASQLKKEVGEVTLSFREVVEEEGRCSRRCPCKRLG